MLSETERGFISEADEFNDEGKSLGLKVRIKSENLYQKYI